MAGVYFISLGCDKNRIDAEIMAKRLCDEGHFIAETLEDADCAVVNTCGFIESAKQQAIENIFDMVRAKESGRIKGIVVTGCLAQRYREELCELIPEADAVLGLSANGDICEAVSTVLSGGRLCRFGSAEELCVEGERLVSTVQHYAYIKIAEGCSNHCTYCAIPSIRGRFRSRKADDVVAEAEKLVESGVRELIVIAQDTTSYGRDIDGGDTLAALLRRLCSIEGLWKVRLLYAYPDRIDDELISLFALEKRLAKYIDIPFQHANERVLRRMGRFGSKDRLLELVQRLRETCPDISIRSTFIVGFPGETEEQFLELCDFMRTARLDRVGCFEYSSEEGTAAARLSDQLDEATKQLRADQFMTVATSVLSEKRRDAIGQSLEVICDGFDEERGMFACRSEFDAPEIDTGVFLPLEADLMPGEIYRVRVVSADEFDLFAELE